MFSAVRHRVVAAGTVRRASYDTLNLFTTLVTSYIIHHPSSIIQYDPAYGLHSCLAPKTASKLAVGHPLCPVPYEVRYSPKFRQHHPAQRAGLDPQLVPILLAACAHRPQRNASGLAGQGLVLLHIPTDYDYDYHHHHIIHHIHNTVPTTHSYLPYFPRRSPLSTLSSSPSNNSDPLLNLVRKSSHITCSIILLNFTPNPHSNRWIKAHPPSRQVFRLQAPTLTPLTTA